MKTVLTKLLLFKKVNLVLVCMIIIKNQNFSKRIKIFYKDGKVEYKTIKHGQQLLIKQAGIIVDLNPDASNLYERDVYYITQKQLDEGNTGSALTNWQTYYLKSDNSGQMNGPLALKYIR